ncbi:MAG TPA: hypothetical protein VNU95_13785 [Candidatus Acidoferrales bacterium]|nr:hypothetical protein [Candidatus Acidoferrales bacterium]
MAANEMRAFRLRRGYGGRARGFAYGGWRSGLEGPANPAQGQPLLDDGVLIYVTIVVIVDESVVKRPAENDEREDGQKKGDPDDPCL